LTTVANTVQYLYLNHTTGETMNKKPFCHSSKEVLALIDQAKPVLAYRNIHKNCISVKQGSLVVCHAQNVVLENATFVVGEKGRDRVRTERSKNVHAFIKGTVVNPVQSLTQLDYRWPEITYNPYTCDFFKCVDNDRYVDRAEWVDLWVDMHGSSIVAHNIMYKKEK